MNQDMRPTDSDGGSQEDLAEFAEVTGPLRRLGEAIDRMRYPGEAWPVRRGARAGRVVRWALATAAAAAVLLAGAAAVYWAVMGGGIPAGPPQPGPAQVAATAPADTVAPGEPAEHIRIDPSIASGITWSIPSFTMPATVDPNASGWSVPSFTFPSFSAPLEEAPPRPTGGEEPTG